MTKIAQYLYYAGLGLTAALGLNLAMPPAHAADRVVNVYNWSDFIDPKILEDFTKETGIKVVYDVYDNDEILQTKLLAGGSGYDVVVPSGTFFSQEIAAGAFQPLDKSKIPNLANAWPQITKLAETYDPGNKYGVVYMWGTTGIGFNKTKVKERLPDVALDTSDTVFKPGNIAKLKSCGVYVLDSSDDVIPAALVFLGIDPNSQSPSDIKNASSLLESIRPYVRKFHSSEYISALANGDICMAIGYSGDVKQAASRALEAKNGQQIDYIIPKEGAQVFLDFLAVPKDAKNAGEAFEFINYLMRPEVSAKASNFISYPNGNLASQAFLNPEIKNDPAIYPPDEVMKRLFVKKPYGTKTRRLVTRTWTKVTTGE